MHVKEIYVILIHLFDSGILLIIDLNKKKGKKSRETASEMQQPSCKSKSFGLVLWISKKLKNKCMYDGLEIFSYVI